MRECRRVGQRVGDRFPHVREVPTGGHGWGSVRRVDGLRTSGRRRSPTPVGARLVARTPEADRTAAGRGGLCGTALAPAVGPRGRSHPPTRHRRGAATRRRAPSRQPHRHRLGRSHAHPRGHAGAEGPLSLPAAERRGVLVPAVQRARRGQRSGEPGHARRARRRRLRRQRTEDLDDVRAHVALRDPHRAHRCGRTQAPGHLVLHLSHGPAGHRDPAHRRDDRRPSVQRGVLRRRAHSCRTARWAM